MSEPTGSGQGAPAREPQLAGATALVIAHPGHELRVHGWLERMRPAVFVLTDGSGACGRPRLASTTRVLERAGARAGCIYGRLSDRALYELLLAVEPAPLLKLAAELLDALLREGVTTVAADAAEGFSPAHDLCRHLVDAVVERARRAGRELASLAFALDAAPDVEPAGSLQLQLSDPEFERKLAAARSYAELDDEVRQALTAHGTDAFRREILWPVAAASPSLAPARYEAIGAERRAAGVYGQVIRRAEHVAPLQRALVRFGDARGE